MSLARDSRQAAKRGCRGRVRAAALLALVAAAPNAFLAGQARAAGGPTIAAAPPVPIAVTLNGNTYTDQLDSVTENLGPSASCPGSGEFWVVSLIAGDQVTLKGTSLAPAAQLWVDIFPAGTTDADLPTTQPLVSDPLGSLSLTATKTGIYPILIGTSDQCGASDGPFNFAVFAVHKAVITLAHVKQLTRQGTLVADVEAPDGTPITSPRLRLRLLASYSHSPGAAATEHLLATATPLSGAATFSFTLPIATAGTTIHLEVLGSGVGYQPIAPVSATVKVAR